MWFVIIFNLLLLTTCVYAFRRGGAPEKIFCLILVVGSIATKLAAPDFKWRSEGVEWGIFGVDVMCMAGFLALALQANRFWPMYVCAFHGLALLGHFSVFIAPEMSQLLYATLAMGSAWPQLFIVMAGTRRVSALRDAGFDVPDWTEEEVLCGRRQSGKSAGVSWPSIH